MKSSRRWMVALALTLMAAGGVGAAFGSAALHGNGSGAGTSAGNSWYRANDGVRAGA